MDYDTDDVSSCCSSSSSQHDLFLPPLRDRFADIPEPIRSKMIDASTQVMKQHLKDTADRILRLWGPCRGCTEDLARAVMAAEGAGVEVEEEYKAMLAQLRAAELLGQPEKLLKSSSPSGGHE